MTTEIQQAETKYIELKDKALALVTTAQTLVISDDKAYEAGVRLGRVVSSKIKEVQFEFEPSRTAAHKAWKAVCDLEAKLADPLKKVKELMANATGAYSQRKQEEARKEQERLLAEARQKQKEAEEAQLKHAAELEAKGDFEEAETIMSEVIKPKQINVQTKIAPPQAKGAIGRTYWHFRVVNLALVPKAFWKIDEDMIQKFVNMHKERAICAGVEFYSETKTGFRN